MDNIAVVFSGGGAKGAYAIGVWKALCDLNIASKVKVISATSIGAVNALLCVNNDINKAIDFWKKIRRDDIAPLRIREINKMIRRGSLFSKENIENLIENNLNIDIIKASGIDILVTCTNLKYGFPKKEVYKLNNYEKQIIKDIIISSCCVPLAFKHHKIKNRGIYFDGGITSRTPIDALNKNEFDKIIVIHLDRFGKLNLIKFRSNNVINIYPSSFQGGILNGTYGFVEELSCKKINRGYNDAINILKNVF